MAFELLTGHLPFKGDLGELQQQQPSASPNDILSAEFRDLIERATHKNPLFRYKSASQFLRALQHASSSSTAHSSLLELVARTRGDSHHPPTSTAPPIPSSSYFERLSTIAGEKRADRPTPTPEQPPLSSHKLADYCLNCGYDRHALTLEAPCPECGQPNLVQQQRAVCSDLARRPFALWLRFLLLRRLPLGWWQLLDDPKSTWFTPLRAWLIFCAGSLICIAIAFLVIYVQLERSFEISLYFKNSPQPVKWFRGTVYVPLLHFWESYRAVEDQYASRLREEFAEERGEPARFIRIGGLKILEPGKRTDDKDFSTQFTRSTRLRIDKQPPSRFLPFALCLLAQWPILRYTWLNLLLFRRRDLSSSDRATVRRAAMAHSTLSLTLPLWLSIPIVFAALPIGWLPIYTETRELAIWFLLIATLIGAIYSAIVWVRTLQADRSERIFPNRDLAVLLLFLVILAQALLFSLLARTLTT